MHKVLQKIVLVLGLLFTPLAFSEVGINFGFGAPYITQLGIDYQMSKKFTFELAKHDFSIDVGTAAVELAKTDIGVKWHIFEGSFFLGASFGPMSFSAKGTSSGNTVTFDVSGNALTAKLGWMWGIDDGGFFGGMEFGMQQPMGTSVTITNSSGLPSSNTAYQDAEDSANKYAESSLPVTTLFRLGYLF